MVISALVAGLAACGGGSDGGGGSSNGDQGYGAYEMNLTFPDELYAGNSESINCGAAGIAWLRVQCFNSDDILLQEDTFACDEHEGTLDGIPTGTNLRIEVTAEDSGNQVLLYGESSASVTIRPNETTIGDPIVMAVDDGDDGPDGPDDGDIPDIGEYGITFVYIRPGEFLMGSPQSEVGRAGNETQHLVSISQGFYMQETEVTQDQWAAVMGNTPSRFSNCGGDCPVERVSWDDANDFITQLNQERAGRGFRYYLPTEAEWEYAARGGTDAGSETAYCFGNDAQALPQYGWYDANSFTDGKYSEGDSVSVADGLPHGTQLVGQLLPNRFGLLDMHGNVYEWCEDLYAGNYGEAALSTDVASIDPSGPTSGNERRVTKGGAWSAPASSCRSAFRFDRPQTDRAPRVGFRLVAKPSGQ